MRISLKVYFSCIFDLPSQHQMFKTCSNTVGSNKLKQLSTHRNATCPTCSDREKEFI